MKFIAVLLLFTFMQGKAQLDDYFHVFMPNDEKQMALMKASAQKTVVMFNGGLDGLMFFSEQDSLNHMEDIKKYDKNGRLLEHEDYYKSVSRYYKYDDKGRVTQYAEKLQGDGNGFRLNLTISYTKKGKITEVKNTADDMEARTVAYYEKEEKLIISTIDGFTDEIYFKEGRIVKVIGKAYETENYLADYVYDNDGRVQQQTGHWENMDAVQNYIITTMYNAAGDVQNITQETWPPNHPTEKVKEVTVYFYSKENVLQSKVTERADGSQEINNYEYDEKKRLAKTDWFDNDMYLVSLYTRYY